jgi:uncharacterized membrane protein YeaQ/YmgE (transglycosylase-associated protein family)
VIVFSFFLYMVVVGMAAGWIAHLILERGTRENWTVLFLVGVLGSFLVGIAGSLIVDGDLKIHPSGLIGSAIGAIILLALYHLFMGRPTSSGGGAPSGSGQQHHASSAQQHHSSSRKRKKQPGHQGARSSRKHR